LLKTEGIDGYRIKIEPESMAMTDWAREQKERSEAIQGVGVFMQSVTGLIQTEESITPYILEILKWFLGGFSKGREIESVLDKAIQAAQQPKPPKQPTPQEQAETAKTKSQSDADRASAVKNLSDAMMQGFVAPANASLQMMGLPPADPAAVASIIALENPPPAPRATPPGASDTSPGAGMA
jgi:hypothetical protein